MTWSSRLSEFYGADVLAVLDGAESVEAWGLTYKDDDMVGRLVKFRTTGRVDGLEDGALEELRRVLPDDAMYEFEHISRVPFRPQQAFVVKAGEAQVVLLIDLRRHKLGWVVDERPRCVDLRVKPDAYQALAGLVERTFGVEEEGA